MEEQISSQQLSQFPQEPMVTPPATPSFLPPNLLTPAIIEQMKAQAKQEAIRMAQRSIMPPMPVRAPVPPQNQNVVYMRRNLTIAELLLTLVIACGIVSGVQVGWKWISNSIPQIEIKVK